MQSFFLKKEIKTTFVSTKNKTNSSFLKYQISNKALKLKKTSCLSKRDQAEYTQIVEKVCQKMMVVVILFLMQYCLLQSLLEEKKGRKQKILSQRLSCFLYKKISGEDSQLLYQALRTMGDSRRLYMRQGEHLNTKFMKIKDHLNMQQANSKKIEIWIIDFSTLCKYIKNWKEQKNAGQFSIYIKN